MTSIIVHTRNNAVQDVETFSNFGESEHHFEEIYRKNFEDAYEGDEEQFEENLQMVLSDGFFECGEHAWNLVNM